MTYSILNDALLLKNKPPEELQEYLHTINLLIFDPIFKNSQNLKEAQQTILFILCSYSEDSPLLILRRDSEEEKTGICEYLDIPEFMRGKLMQLSDAETRRATTTYIQQFASPLFKALKLLEIQLDDLNMAITNRVYVTVKEGKEGKEEVTIPLYDFGAHAKAVTQYELLCKRKDALEKELKSTIQFKGIADLKEYKFQNLDKKIAKGANGISVENSKLIKLGNG